MVYSRKQNPAVTNKTEGQEVALSPSSSLYENVAMVGFRAGSILEQNNRELIEMIEQLGPSYEEEENTFDKTRLVLVNKFERREKPIRTAIRECYDGKLLYGQKVKRSDEV